MLLVKVMPERKQYDTLGSMTLADIRGMLAGLKSDFFGFNITLPVKTVFASLLAIWITFPDSTQLLVKFMAADYLTGLWAALVLKQLDSHKACIGLTKKVVVLLIVWLSHELSHHLMAEQAGGMDIGKWVALFYVAVEGISLIENAHRIGVPLPPFLKEALVKIRDFNPAGKASPANLPEN